MRVFKAALDYNIEGKSKVGMPKNTWKKTVQMESSDMSGWR